MTINKYFNETKNPNEQNLVESLIIEGIQITGQDMYYLPRTSVTMDNLLNEDNARFDSFKVIEMYVPNPENYASSNYNIGGFGMPLDRSIDFVVSRKRFKQETSMPNPKEGDLIFAKYSNQLWEITFVDFEIPPIYQLQKQFIFSLTCRPFVSNHEDFNTGIESLDDDIAALTDPYAHNETLNEEMDDVLDYDIETDPFQDNLTGE